MAQRWNEMNDLYPLLSSLASPADLHKMSDKELQQIADEVRQAILREVSKTGGHFSSNLGTVELTVALYATYHLPSRQSHLGHRAPGLSSQTSYWPPRPLFDIEEAQGHEWLLEAKRERA